MSTPSEEKTTHGEPLLRLFATARDTNTRGDVFGGWLLANIDLAASILAVKRAQGSVATVAMKNANFLQPIYPSDLVSFYGEVEKVGRTSLTIKIEVLIERSTNGEIIKEQAADAQLVFVAISEPGKPRELP